MGPGRRTVGSRLPHPIIEYAAGTPVALPPHVAAGTSRPMPSTFSTIDAAVDASASRSSDGARCAQTAPGMRAFGAAASCGVNVHASIARTSGPSAAPGGTGSPAPRSASAAAGIRSSSAEPRTEDARSPNSAFTKSSTTGLERQLVESVTSGSSPWRAHSGPSSAGVPPRQA